MFQRRHPRGQPAGVELAVGDRRVRQGGRRARSTVCARAWPTAVRRRCSVRHEAAAARLLALLDNDRGERVAVLRDEMGDTMEAGVGIYRSATGMQACLRQVGRVARRGIGAASSSMTGSRAFNTEWLSTIELGFTLEVAEAMAHSALGRRGIARRPCAAGRIQDARRRELPAALAGTLYRRRPAVNLAGAGNHHQVATSHAQLWRRRQEGGDDMTTLRTLAPTTGRRTPG